MHVIQGVFWQALFGQYKDKWGPLSVLPLSADRKWFPFAFAGSLHMEPPAHGSMVDPFGAAELRHVGFGDRLVTFDKLYPDTSVIRYSLRPARERHEWVGLFEGESCGNGFVRCTIVPVTMEDFSHYAIQLALNQRPSE